MLTITNKQTEKEILVTEGEGFAQSIGKMLTDAMVKFYLQYSFRSSESCEETTSFLGHYCTFKQIFSIYTMMLHFFLYRQFGSQQCL